MVFSVVRSSWLVVAALVREALLWFASSVIARVAAEPRLPTPRRCPSPPPCPPQSPSPSPSPDVWVVDERPVLAFSSGGLLWAYFVGVIAALRDHFDLTDVRATGNSCGCSAAAIVFLDLSVAEAFRFGLALERLMRSRVLRFLFLSTRDVFHALYGVFESLGVDDEVLAAKRAQRGANGVCFGVTTVAGWAPRCLDGFASVKEMMYAATCSMRVVPFFRTPGWFRGELVVDGGLSHWFCVPPDAVETRVVRISCFSVAPHCDVQPTHKEAFPLYACCQGGPLSVHLARFRRGYRDVVAQLERLGKKGLRPHATGAPGVSCPPEDRLRDWCEYVATSLRQT